MLQYSRSSRVWYFDTAGLRLFFAFFYAFTYRTTFDEENFENSLGVYFNTADHLVVGYFNTVGSRLGGYVACDTFFENANSLVRYEQIYFFASFKFLLSLEILNFNAHDQKIFSKV